MFDNLDICLVFVDFHGDDQKHNRNIIIMLQSNFREPVVLIYFGLSRSQARNNIKDYFQLLVLEKNTSSCTAYSTTYYFNVVNSSMYVFLL